MDKKLFFGVVSFLAIAAGGILIWQVWLPHHQSYYQSYNYWVNPVEPMPSVCTQEAKICPDGSSVNRTGPNCEFIECPVETLETIIPLSIEISGWNTYTNQEYGLTFEYPKEWGNIQIESLKTNGLYPLTSSNAAIEKAWYHQPSGKLIFISRGPLCTSYGGSQFYEQTLAVLDQKGIKGKIILEKPTTIGGGYCRQISAVNLSPNGKYAYAEILSYENYELRIINIQTGVNIIEGRNVLFNTFDDIVWSPDNNLLAIKSQFDFSGFGGGGINGVFLSAYNKPEQLNQIFSLNNEDAFNDYQVYNLHFINNNKLAFVIGKMEEGILKDIKAKYEYDAQTKELKKLSQ